MKNTALQRYFWLSLATLGGAVSMGGAAEVAPRWLEQAWDARWIRAVDSSDSDYGVYFFRKEIELDRKPERFVVHVSADCRYKLYVNGAEVSQGPAAGDYFHWNFESVDLARKLTAGRNVVSALVWNEGEHRPEYQISYRTGFILQGDGEAESVLNTGTSWRAARSKAHTPIVGIGYDTYYVSGPGEERDMRAYAPGWKELDFDDSGWSLAEEVPVGWPRAGKPKGVRDAAGWMLVPRSIPELELTPQRFAAVRKAEGVEIPEGFPGVSGSIEIPANAQATFVLDQGALTNAYPQLEFSRGRDATIELTYAESPYVTNEDGSYQAKGNRDEIEGKAIVGRRDRIVSDGSRLQRFESLSWRTFRYVKVQVTTQKQRLVIDDLASVFIGYPFRMRASFDAGSEELDEILEIGWRTARLCAVETYMDCPYYEQLQYIGDTRIQALVSLYNSGDDRLLRNALNLMDQSRIAEGVTMSRHPSKTPQIISTFSLWYIGMLSDYWRYGDDADFVADKLDGARQVLAFFHRFQGADGRLSRPPYWLFTDWVRDREGWDFGEPPFGEEGESSVLDLQLLWAYQVASELEAALGMEAYATLYAERAEQLQQSIREAYWDAERGLLRDTLAADSPLSQHANTLGILTGTLDAEEAAALAPRLESGEGMAPASIYFRYYLHQALAKAGRGDRYLSWLDKWRENIDMGLTTWAEISEIDISRSDCHAWGSSPNIEFFRIVLGIDSAAPGFKRVRVAPQLGDLERARGAIPHPAGTVLASYEKSGDAWTVRIELPEKVDGVLVWEGSEYALSSGRNVLELSANPR